MPAIPDLLGAEFPAVITPSASATLHVAALLREAHRVGEPIRAVLEAPDRDASYDLGVAPQPDGGSVITVTPLA